jgi:hypothetical protein
MTTTTLDTFTSEASPSSLITAPASITPGVSVPYVATPGVTTSTSVPAFVVRLLDPDFTGWDSVGVRVGGNIEADVDALDAINPGLGARAGAYWERCRDFWDTYAAGHAAGHAVRIDRRVAYSRQSDTRNGRVDLTGELAALEALPLLGPLVTELTGASPSRGDLDSRYAPLIVTTTTNGDETVVTAEFPARQDFPSALGGPHSRGELARRFRLTVNHAKWRDRRVRRLVCVDVEAIEIWPDPTAY